MLQDLGIFMQSIILRQVIAQCQSSLLAIPQFLKARAAASTSNQTSETCSLLLSPVFLLFSFVFEPKFKYLATS